MIGRNKQYEAFDQAILNYLEYVRMRNEAFEDALLLDHLECIDVGATELAVNGMYIIRILNPGPDQY